MIFLTLFGYFSLAGLAFLYNWPLALAFVQSVYIIEAAITLIVGIAVLV
jgi:hypothetical protein